MTGNKQVKRGGLCSGICDMLEDKELARKIFKRIFLFSFIFRIYYSLFAAYNISPHDLGPISAKDWTAVTPGHLSYVQIICENIGLPSIMKGQLYHPPIYHILASLIYGPLYALSHNVILSFEPVQTLNICCSGLIAVFCFKILEEMDVKGIRLIVSTIFFAFMPLLINLGAALNNDCLMNLFSVISLWYCLKWRKDHSWKRIILCAVFLVLAMLTKTSGVFMASAIGAIFACAFFKSLKDGKWKGLIKQYVVFALISIPLGLSWVIRMKIVYGLPFSYVYPLPEHSTLLIEKPFIERIGLAPLVHFTSYQIGVEEPQTFYNIWGCFLQTAVYDEGITNAGYTPMRVIAAVMVCLFAIITIILTVDFVRMLMSKTVALDLKLCMGLLYLTMFISYVSFCCRYPYTCTMSARYVFPVFIPLLASYGLMPGTKSGVAEVVTGGLISVFALLTVVLYFLPYELI